MSLLKFCEICFRRPKEVGTLRISSCQHMVCRRCSPGNSTSAGTCAVCQKEARFQELNDATMSAQLKEYFNEDDQLAKSCKVAQFQMEKMDKFIAGKIHVLAEYEEKKKTMRKLKEHADSLKKAILQETEMIRKLRGRRKSPGSTPPPSLNVSAGDSTESLRVATLERNMQKLAVKRNRTPATTSSSSSESNLFRGQRSSVSRSGGSSSCKRTPVSSPGDDVFKMPTYSPSLHKVTTPNSAELPATTRDRIYQQQVRNMDKAMSVPSGSSLKVKNRGSDIERARHMHF